MRKELIASLTLHLVIILLILFVRFPQQLLKEEDLIIPIEIANIGDVTQSNKPLYAEEPKPVSKVEEPLEEPKPTPSVEPIKPPEPEPPEPQEPVTPESSPEEVKPEPEEVLPPEEAIEEPKEKEKPKEKPQPPSLPKVKPKVPAQKEEPKEEKPEKKSKEKVQTSEMDKLLNALIPEDAEKGEETASPGDKTGDNLPKGDESMVSIKALAMKHIKPCWNVNDGAKNAENLAVAVDVQFNPDGTVKRIDVLEMYRMKTDPAYKVAVERVVNAFKDPRCATFPFPKKTYSEWRKLPFNFDPSKMGL